MQNLEDFIAQAAIDGAWEMGDGSSPAAVLIPQSDGRNQRVFVLEFEVENAARIRVTSVIGPAGDSTTRLRSALSLNLNLPEGAIALDGEKLVLTETLLLTTTTPETFAAAIRFVATNADRYERILFKTDVE